MKPFERTKDKVCIAGFAKSRDKAPWDDESYEIWIMNEEAHFDWCKRYDRVFQMHPRWNFTMPDNPNDPNHWYWLQDVEGTCRRCNGTKKFKYINSERLDDCTQCDEKGMYYRDPRRKDAIIYMQKKYPDIPNSVAYPLKKISKELNPQMKGDYFSSTCAYALALAVYMGYETIETYGIEMSNNTEYGFQRPNMEYWIGLARGKGITVTPHTETGGLLSSGLYGYTNMKIGYRQDVEARMKNLENQHIIAHTNMDRYYGKFAMISQLRDDHPEDAEGWKAAAIEVEEQYRRYVGEYNYVLGAQREVKNLMDLYDVHYEREATGESNEEN